ncbi:MAG: hypothetical protein LDL39_13830 [Magnetospirillum sp.]|nr:hypothetical protein [Magnetospirillum sp.]
MTDRPTLFSTPMVLALLREAEQPGAGKTQTRRLASSPLAKCRAGDRLWVREAWAVPENWGNKSATAMATSCLDAGYERPWAPIHFLADGSRNNWGDWREIPPGKGRPSIHMPRWASRLTLVVKEVRFQRLQDISEEDARAEGLIQRQKGPQKGGWHWEEWSGEFGDWAFATARDAYAELWEFLHGEEAWNENPEVVAVTFAVHAVNIDALEAAHG